MTIRNDHVPLGIRSRGSWVGMKYETREGKQTKIPINPHN